MEKINNLILLNYITKVPKLSDKEKQKKNCDVLHNLQFVNFLTISVVVISFANFRKDYNN